MSPVPRSPFVAGLLLGLVLAALPFGFTLDRSTGVPVAERLVALADDDGGDDGDDDDNDDRGDRSDRGGRGERRTSGRGEGGSILDLFRRAPAAPAVRQAAPPPPPAAAARELVAIGLSEGDLDGLAAEGFRILTVRILTGGDRLVRLGIPDGVTLDEARSRVSETAPGAETDLNHYYRPQEGSACSAPLCPFLDLVGWRTQPTCTTGIAIGLIDTAVNADHAVFEGRDLTLLTLRDEASRPSEEKHGTAVAALLIGVPGGRVPGLLPEASLVAVDPFARVGTDERSDAFALVAAIDALRERSVKVVNLSLAGPDNRVVADSVRQAVAAGIVMVAAVGNAGHRAKPLYPAAYPGVIGVTAVDSGLRLYRRALRGAQVDLAAPGVGVPTAASIRGVRPQTGTSFATPFVTAAAAAVLAAEPALTPEAVLDRLVAGARDLGDPGRDDAYGHGLVAAPPRCGSTAGSPAP